MHQRSEYRRAGFDSRQPFRSRRLGVPDRLGDPRRGGPTVDPSEYYLRAAPSFEVEKGRHDWLMRHVFVGLGERKADGNLVRYYKVL